jgi:transcriptional regulator with XRE-family HTH domain
VAVGRLSAIDIEVGRRVRAARIAHGKTQEELADAVGVSFQQIQKYEKGSNRIGMGRLHAIAKFLDEPVDYFFAGIDQDSRKSAGESTTSAIAEALSTKEGVRIAVALSRIGNLERRRRIADLLEAMIDRESRPVRSLRVV